MDDVRSDLALVSEAGRMLAEARTLDQIRHVHNVAQRAQDYARAARLGLDAQNSAAAIRIEAEAKAGELLARMERDGERATGRGDKRADSQPASPPPTLADLGVTPDESSRWQAVAQVPAETRSAYVAESQERETEVTRAGLMRRAGIRPVKAEPTPDPMAMNDVHRRKFPDLVAAELSAELASAVAKVRTDVLVADKWADRVGAMSRDDLAHLRSKVAHVHRWADAWDALLSPKPLRVVGGP